MIDSYRRQLVRRINFLEIEVKRAEDLQISFKNFKETYQVQGSLLKVLLEQNFFLIFEAVELTNLISTIEELWAKIPLFAAEMEQDIKDDLQAGLWDLVNSSSIDLGVQLPKVILTLKVI